MRLILQDLRKHDPTAEFHKLSLGCALSVGIKCVEAIEEIHNVGYVTIEIRNILCEIYLQIVYPLDTKRYLYEGKNRAFFSLFYEVIKSKYCYKVDMLRINKILLKYTLRRK